MVDEVKKYLARETDPQWAQLVMCTLIRNAKKVVKKLFHVEFHRASIFNQYYYSFPM